MVELKEKLVQEIINAEGTKPIERIINSYTDEMRKNGIEQYRILNFIRRLDIALLMLEKRELTHKQWVNTKYAQKILIEKIINGMPLCPTGMPCLLED
jgi:hypothetical protein